MRMWTNLRLFTAEYGSTSQIISLACALRLCPNYVPLSLSGLLEVRVQEDLHFRKPRFVFIMYSFRNSLTRYSKSCRNYLSSLHDLELLPRALWCLYDWLLIVLEEINKFILIHVPCIFYYFVLWPTNAPSFHYLSHSNMFRHYRVILRELVVSTLPSYTRMLNAVFGNTI